jgi:NAD(P)-dependent dehydrogenase (short-subunit alcohol dehydrogenase family)
MQDKASQKIILIVGASRGLGFALVEEYLKRGYHVIATARAASTDKLQRLADTSAGALEVETVDITIPAQIAALRARLADRHLDVLFVNAGVINDNGETIVDVSTEEFTRLMVTNALSPMRVIDAFEDLVAPTGTIGVMSSGLGSLTNATNATNANFEVYRGSKAALNMFMRTYSARTAEYPRTLLLIAPGWVRTDMGGPDARLTIDESIPNVVNTIEAHAGRAGLHYLDYLGNTVPW